MLPNEEEIHFSGIEIDLLSGSKEKHQSIELSLLIFLDKVIPYCILKLTPDSTDQEIEKGKFLAKRWGFNQNGVLIKSGVVLPWTR